MRILPEKSGFLHDPVRIFKLLVILIFILLPILSLDAGISGDEPVHHEHASLVMRYYSSKGLDTAALHTPETHLRLYGQSVDNLAYRIESLLKTGNPWLVRHLTNALFGAATIWVCGLLAMELAGAWAGILAMLLLLLSPRFLGHSFNNLKDVPFAFAYLLTLWSMIRFIRPFPRIRLWPLAGMLAGTTLALSIRAGGLVLMPMVAFFSLLQGWMKRPAKRLSEPINLKFFSTMVGSLVLMFVAAWFGGIIDWPWARIEPLSRPLEALREMTRYQVSIRQLFEGRLLWSEDLPWYYPIKFIAMTTPVVLLAGLFAIPFLSWKRDPVAWSLILFAILFPVFWVIVQDSNLYGGMRHLLFVVPPLSILSAAGWIALLSKAANLRLRLPLILLIMAGLLAPALHIARNHPVAYVYFNRLAGGFGGAWQRYETDYYYHSVGPALRWLDRHLSDQRGEKEVIVASNFPLQPYLNQTKNIRKVVYIPWHERSLENWDWGIFVKTGMSPSLFMNQRWPNGQEVHRINVNGLPVCTVIQRQSKQDLSCRQQYLAGELIEADSCYRQFLRGNPDDEMALLYLGYIQLKLEKVEEAVRISQQLTSLLPDWEPALVLQAQCQLAEGKFSEALATALMLREMNPKFEAGWEIWQRATDSLKPESNY